MSKEVIYYKVTIVEVQEGTISEPFSYEILVEEKNGQLFLFIRDPHTFVPMFFFTKETTKILSWTGKTVELRNSPTVINYLPRESESTLQITFKTTSDAYLFVNNIWITNKCPNALDLLCGRKLANWGGFTIENIDTIHYKCNIIIPPPPKVQPSHEEIREHFMKFVIRESESKIVVVKGIQVHLEISYQVFVKDGADLYVIHNSKEEMTGNHHIDQKTLLNAESLIKNIKQRQPDAKFIIIYHHASEKSATQISKSLPSSVPVFHHGITTELIANFLLPATNQVSLVTRPLCPIKGVYVGLLYHAGLMITVPSNGNTERMVFDFFTNGIHKTSYDKWLGCPEFDCLVTVQSLHPRDGHIPDILSGCFQYVCGEVESVANKLVNLEYKLATQNCFTFATTLAYNLGFDIQISTTYKTAVNRDPNQYMAMTSLQGNLRCSQALPWCILGYFPILDDRKQLLSSLILSCDIDIALIKKAASTNNPTKELKEVMEMIRKSLFQNFPQLSVILGDDIIQTSLNNVVINSVDAVLDAVFHGIHSRLSAITKVMQNNNMKLSPTTPVDTSPDTHYTHQKGKVLVATLDIIIKVQNDTHIFDAKIASHLNNAKNKVQLEINQNKISDVVNFYLGDISNLRNKMEQEIESYKLRLGLESQVIQIIGNTVGVGLILFGIRQSGWIPRVLCWGFSFLVSSCGVHNILINIEKKIKKIVLLKSVLFVIDVLDQFSLHPQAQVILDKIKKSFD